MPLFNFLLFFTAKLPCGQLVVLQKMIVAKMLTAKCLWQKCQTGSRIRGDFMVGIEQELSERGGLR